MIGANVSIAIEFNYIKQLTYVYYKCYSTYMYKTKCITFSLNDIFNGIVLEFENNIIIHKRLSLG